MVVLPPGTQLQLMFLEKRLDQLSPGTFIEIGPGSGEISNRLLRRGWKGTSYDLEPETIKALQTRFSSQVDAGELHLLNEDFLNIPPPDEKVDLVISCMVMEHLDSTDELSYMNQAAKCLNPGGLMVSFVPASPDHWGIEDDIAGHFRRYTRDAVKKLMVKANWTPLHLAGLTYPVSNILLPISNYLVNRAEKSKLDLSKYERTKLSGNRNVNFKTHFPLIAGLVLNKITMLPLFWIQQLTLRSQKALVLYFEAKPQ